MQVIIGAAILGAAFAGLVWFIGLLFVKKQVHYNIGAGAGDFIIKGLLRTGLGLSSLSVAIVGAFFTWASDAAWYAYLSFLLVYSTGVVAYFSVRYGHLRRLRG
jgi:hypothetical protein